MVEVSATDFRKDMFRLMRQAAETGEDVVVRLRGRRFVVRPERSPAELTPEERWARYEEWCRRQDRTSTPPDLDLDAVFAQVAEEARAEYEAEWEEFYGPERSE